MKRAIALLLVCASLLSLCACGVSAGKANTFLADMEDKNFDPDQVSEGTRKKMFESEVFRSAVIEKMSAEEDLHPIFMMISVLEYMGYRDAEVKAALEDILEDYLSGLATSDDNITDIGYYAKMLSILQEDSFYRPDERMLEDTVSYLIENSLLTELLGSTPVESELGKMIRLLKNLSWQCYPIEGIQAVIRPHLAKAVEAWDEDSIVSYVNDVCDYGGADYFTPEELYPYDAVRALAESSGTALSLTGGYYSENIANYEDTHYWYDPLSHDQYTSGGVGLFEVTTKHTPYGDFLYRDYKHYAYMSPGDGRGDEREQVLWLRWQFSPEETGNLNREVLKKQEAITDFLNIAKRGRVYCFDNPKKQLLIMVIESNRITFVTEDEEHLYIAEYN